MPEIVTVDLDQRARDYVRENLGEGLTLARAVAHVWDPDAGHFTAWVPQGSTSEQLYKFHESVGSHTVAPHLEAATLVARELQRVPRAVALVESALARRGDPAPEEWRCSKLFFGAEVYAVFRPDDANPEKIRIALRELASATVLHVVVADDSLETFVAGSELHDGWAEMIAPLVRLIVVGAYDDESYVVWRRDR